MTEVYTFGESMARLTSPIVGPMRHAHELAVGIAGAESNVAIGLARLGTSVCWTGRVGDDEFGRLITSVLRGEGVDTRAIADPEAPTGLLLKSRRSSSASEVVYYRTGSAGGRLGPDDLDHEAIAAARVLHLSGITAALGDSARAACFAAIETAQAHGTAVALDLNMRRKLWTEEAAAPVLRELVRRASIVFATADEAEIVVPAADAAGLATALAALGPTEVVIKLGAEGAVAFSDGEVAEAPRHSVDELDPVGAGDAFTAGYLHEHVRGEEVAARLATAARCGAFAVTVEGDWEGLPLHRELDAFAAGLDVRR